jgi:hypothetical protein
MDLTGFNERRANGFGSFVGRDQIKRIRGGTIIDVLRLVPGVYIGASGFGGKTQISMTRSANLNCRPAIYMDGTKVQDGGAASGRLLGGSEPRIEDLLDTDNMAGVEVYHGESEAPMQYGGKQARCGVILIWSRNEIDKEDAK